MNTDKHFLFEISSGNDLSFTHSALEKNMFQYYFTLPQFNFQSNPMALDYFRGHPTFSHHSEVHHLADNRVVFVVIVEEDAVEEAAVGARVIEGDI